MRARRNCRALRLAHRDATPRDEVPSRIKLKTPLTEANAAALAAALAAEQHEWVALEARLCYLVATEVQPHWTSIQDIPAGRPRTLKIHQGRPARQVIDELGVGITNLLMQAQGGFRNKRLTAQQIELMVSEDAQTFQHDFPATSRPYRGL